MINAKILNLKIYFNIRARYSLLQI